jgi:hypothetical protein
MAVLLNLHLPRDRLPAVRRSAPRTKISFAEIAPGIWDAAAQIVVFLWATLALTFLGLIAAGLFFA